MKKDVIVISLGGSLIIPDDVDGRFLSEFKKVLKKNSKKYKFVVVCGGGSLARKYIRAIESQGHGHVLQSLAGINATRANARFMSYFFGEDSRRGIPHSFFRVKRELRKKDVVFCGALEYKPNQTSDSTSADIARKLNCEFVNMTNVKGLYSKHPKLKGAKFISKISWRDFFRMANKMKFKPGQHFVLDQKAARVIMNNKIRTVILGKNANQLNNLLKGKKFIGTEIFG
jgi:uridylate kinase